MDLTTYILILAALLIWIPWLWRYVIKPYFTKDEVNQKIQLHPAKKRIKKTELFLLNLYRPIKSDLISKRDRKRLKLDSDAFIYGEIQFLSFFTLLDRVHPQPNEIFYDLGSGTGKAVLAAVLFFDIAKAYGIELLPSLSRVANRQLQKVIEQVSDLPPVQFIQGDFLQYDFSDGDIIFVNATCLSYYTWEAMLEKLAKLKPGSRVIVTTKKIQQPQFQLQYQGLDLMSWGMNSVNIYLKIS